MALYDVVQVFPDAEIYPIPTTGYNIVEVSTILVSSFVEETGQLDVTTKGRVRSAVAGGITSVEATSLGTMVRYLSEAGVEMLPSELVVIEA